MPVPDPQNPSDFPDGTIVIGTPSNTMFVLYGGAKFLIPDPSQLNALGLGQAPRQTATDFILHATPSIPNDGTTLRELSNPKVFTVYASCKLWVPDIQSFSAWGFQWSDVKLVPDGALGAIPDAMTSLPENQTPVTVAPQGSNIPTPTLNLLQRPGTPPTLNLPNSDQNFEVLPMGSIIAQVTVPDPLPPPNPENPPPTGMTRNIEVDIDGMALFAVNSNNIPLQSFLTAKGHGYYSTASLNDQYSITIVFPPGKLSGSGLTVGIKNMLVYSLAGQMSVSSPLNIHIVPQTAASGWLSRITQNNQVEFLIDGEGTFPRVDQTLAGASSNIYLLQLAFDPTCASTFSSGETIGPQNLLAQTLLNTNRRGVPARVLLDDLDADITITLLGFIPIYHTKVNVSFMQELLAFFNQQGNNTVRIAGFPLVEPERLHAKALIVDHQQGFILGLPFQQEYWDSSQHWVEDVRRSSNKQQNNNQPVHTLTLGIRGPAVTHLEELFIQLWNANPAQSKSSPDQLSPAPVPAPAGTQTLQIVRTLPDDVSTEEGILEACKQAIANAKHFIYLEQQYFTCRPIIDALKQAMDANPSLQVILLFNVKPDIPTYEFWQDFRLLNTLGFPRPQLGVFTLWSMRASPNAPGMRDLENCYVESKVTIIDDSWAMVGTANLDGMSLEGALNVNDGDVAQAMADVLETIIPLSEFDANITATSNLRSVEVSAVLLDGIEGQPQTGNVAALRHALWAEHLGPDANVSAPPAGGWLGLWNAVASANAASLSTTPPSMKGRILPYTPTLPISPSRTLQGTMPTQQQIQSLGIPLNNLNVIEAGSPPPFTALDARFIAWDVPGTMQADQSFTFHITMQNNNVETWVASGNNPVRLGSQALQDNTTWGTNRASLPFDVAPGMQVSIPITVKAPHINGSYTFQWRMVKEGITWFGDFTPSVAVKVSGGKNPKEKEKEGKSEKDSKDRKDRDAPLSFGPTGQPQQGEVGEPGTAQGQSFITAEERPAVGGQALSGQAEEEEE